MKILNVSRNFSSRNYANYKNRWWVEREIYLGIRYKRVWAESKEPKIDGAKVSDVTHSWFGTFPKVHKILKKKGIKKRKLIYESY